MTKIKDIDTALNQFEVAAMTHAEATENGDYKTANKSYAAIAKAIAFLKQKGELRVLSRFLDHSSASVQVWTAMFLLPIYENDAVRVLTDVAKGTGILSFDAKNTLSEWRKGNLRH